MANTKDQSNASSKPSEVSETPSTSDLYRQMFEAYGSKQPSTRDLYKQMFSVHGIPTPQLSVQQPEGMVTLEGKTTAQASTQGLYRHMFAAHGIPTPRPPVQQPKSMVALGRKEPFQTLTDDLYRQMFTSHGRSTPVTFQGRLPKPAPISEMYYEMFTAHADRPGDSPMSSSVEPDLPRNSTCARARNLGVPTSGTAATNGQGVDERPQVKQERF